MARVPIYSPEGQAVDSAGPTTITPVFSMAGLRIAVLDNGKAGADRLLERMGRSLADRSGARFVGRRRKGSAATPCEPDLLETLVGEADVVLTGTAD